MLIFCKLETRLCNFRKDVKKLVTAALSGHYKLVPGSTDYSDRVEKLKFNDNYIYPGDVMVSYHLMDWLILLKQDNL